MKVINLKHLGVPFIIPFAGDFYHTTNLPFIQSEICNYHIFSDIRHTTSYSRSGFRNSIYL
jgi:hypothetical protein